MTPTPCEPTGRRSARPGVLVAALLPLAALVPALALASPAAASPTSNEVVYISDVDVDGRGAVVLRDLGTRAERVLLPEDNANFTYEDPELSPDGSRVALATNRGWSPSATAIQVLGVGGGLTRITSPGPDQLDLSPAWSVSGGTLMFTRLTFDSARNLARSQVMQVAATPGAEVVDLVPGVNAFAGDWSPDASGATAGSIVYTQITDLRTGAGELKVRRRDNGAVRTLQTGPDARYPAWSPDGRTIAYQRLTVRDTVRFPDGTPRGADVVQIGSVESDGTQPGVDFGPTRFGPLSVAEYPTWAPDGESILYDIFAYDLNGFGDQGGVWAIDRRGIRSGEVVGTGADESQVAVHGPAPTAVTGVGAASTFVPVAPRRIFDTRSGLGRGGRTGRVGPGGIEAVQITGVQVGAGTVPDDASAVVLNVTVADNSANTDVRAFPNGAPLPLVSNINVLRNGGATPNLVTVKVGDGGQVLLRNSGGEVNLIADIAGYYVPRAGGAGYTGVEPVRLFDTRGADFRGPKVQADVPYTFTVKGTFRRTDGSTVVVPPDATSVVLNVTGTGAERNTDIRVYPADAPTVPEVSNLNLRFGQTAPNLVTVAVPTNGQVRFKNGAGGVHLIADLAGYYAASAPGRFVPINPVRFLDTRDGTGGAPILTTPGGFADVKVGGARGVPVGATSAVLNLTGTGPSSNTDVRAYPANGNGFVPEVSNLNLVPGLTRANAVIVRTGDDGRVRVRNNGGTVALITDLAGWFVNP